MHLVFPKDKLLKEEFTQELKGMMSLKSENYGVENASLRFYPEKEEIYSEMSKCKLYDLAYASTFLLGLKPNNATFLRSVHFHIFPRKEEEST